MDADFIHDLILAAIAVFNAGTAYMAWKTHQLTKQVEVATNSMKDALVAAEKKISFGEGQVDQKTRDTTKE
jgi:hypothetical protein